VFPQKEIKSTGMTFQTGANCSTRP